MGGLVVLGIVGIITGFTAMALAQDSSAFAGFCICAVSVVLIVLAFLLRFVGPL
jgi:hypothetical protein